VSKLAERLFCAADARSAMLRDPSDPELLELQEVMLKHFGDYTPEVVEAVRVFTHRPDLELSFVLRAYGIKVS